MQMDPPPLRHSAVWPKDRRSLRTKSSFSSSGMPGWATSHAMHVSTWRGAAGGVTPGSHGASPAVSAKLHEMA